MLNTPPHLEARGPRGFVSIFHGTSSSVARRRLRASDLSFRQSMPSFDIGRPGLHLQSGASAALGGVGEPPGSRCTDFNPRTPCGGRRHRLRPVVLVAGISIHAPRVGRDRRSVDVSATEPHFNPRAPCGARRPAARYRGQECYFNPRAPCGARLTQSGIISAEHLFQSTRPVWGATIPARHPTTKEKFQSTRPVWGATGRLCNVVFVDTISIHAPRVGRDRKFDDFTPSNLHKRYKRVLARPKNTREKGKIKQKFAYIHAFSAFLGCEGSGTFCALVLRTQYR